MVNAGRKTSLLFGKEGATEQPISSATQNIPASCGLCGSWQRPQITLVSVQGCSPVESWMETSPKGLLMWLKLADSLDFEKTFPYTEGSQRRARHFAYPGRPSAHSPGPGPLFWAAPSTFQSTEWRNRCTASSGIRPPWVQIVAMSP